MIMKLLLLFATAFIMAGCSVGNDGDQQAQNVAGAWADAYFNCDFKDASGYVTTESQKWLQYAASNTSAEELKLLHEHPLNINSASVEDFQQIPFLNEQQIESIHAYIYLHGTLKSLGELRLIPLIDEDTYRKLRLFVFAGEKPGQKTFRGIGRPTGALSARTDVPLYYRRGYQVGNGYRGDPLYQRIKLNMTDHRHFQVDARLEKDPGER